MATDVPERCRNRVPEPYRNRTGTSKTVFNLDFSVNLLVFNVPEPYWNRTGTSKPLVRVDFLANPLIVDVPERCRNRTGTVPARQRDFWPLPTRRAKARRAYHKLY